MFLRLIYLWILIAFFNDCFASTVKTETTGSTGLEEFAALKKALSRGSPFHKVVPNESCSMKLKQNNLSNDCLYERGNKQLDNKCFIKALDYYLLYFSDNEFSLDDICDVNRALYNPSGFTSPENDNLIETMRNMPFALTKYKPQKVYENFFLSLPIIVKSNLHSDHFNNFKRFHSLVIVHLLITNNKLGIDKQSPLAQCINDFIDEHSEDINRVLTSHNDATLKKLEITSKNWQCR